METLGTQYAEAMISSLNYTLGRTSSAIVDRREVKSSPGAQTNIRRADKKQLSLRLLMARHTSS